MNEDLRSLAEEAALVGGRLLLTGQPSARQVDAKSSPTDVVTQMDTASEQAIVAHPAVMECAVVAMPDEKWGERPKAFVTLTPGRTATEREIIDFCRGRMAHFKCPSAVEFGELPKTSTGKIQKHVLRKREWSGPERRVD